MGVSDGGNILFSVLGSQREIRHIFFCCKILYFNQGCLKKVVDIMFFYEEKKTFLDV